MRESRTAPCLTVTLLVVKVLSQRHPGSDDGRSRTGIGRSAAMLGVASLCIGSISFAFIFVGSRVLSDEAMADLLSYWAIMNTTVLSMIIPLETLAPRILSGATAKRAVGDGRVALVVHGGGLGVVGGVVSVLIYLADSSGGATMLAIAGLAYCVALGIWSGMRSHLVGSGLFGDALGLAAVTTVVALASIAAVYLADLGSGALLLTGIAAAYMAGLIGWWLTNRHPAERVVGDTPRQRISLGDQNYRMLVTLIGVTFATLILNNGGLVFAGFLDVEARTIVVYAAALNLVRIPLMLINNVTPPINLKMAELAATEQLPELRTLAVRTLAGFTSVLVIGLVATWFLGPFFVRILVGGGSGNVDGRLVALVLLGEGLIWLTVLPRIVCVALGNRRAMIAAWIVGLIGFLTWMLLPIDNEWKVVGGPIVGGLTTLVVGLALAGGLLRQSSRQPDASKPTFLSA